MGPPKWSIRKWLSYFAAQNVDPKDPKAITKLLGNSPTLAQVIAIGGDPSDCAVKLAISRCRRMGWRHRRHVVGRDVIVALQDGVRLGARIRFMLALGPGRPR